MPVGQDTLNTRRTLEVGDKSYDYYSLPAAEAALGEAARLPFSLKVLLENLLRFEDGRSVTVDDARAVVAWLASGRSDREIAYRPARVLMQDFTGVPAVVDLAAMRDAIAELGGDPARINPLSPVDLVIDHSVMVDHFATADAFGRNVELEMRRNAERYAFLHWGQTAFKDLRVVPPGTGICHQVNLEYLARVVWTATEDGAEIAFPDTLVGTDSHTTMINGLGVLGWGVGGIEAEAAMLGQPISMLIPEVVGFRLDGRLREGATATDLVLTVVQMLREKGVVGKFVEFYGPALDELGLADRATIANMAPEYGATCGFFPVDRKTLEYLEGSARPAETVALIEAYARAQGMWRDSDTPEPVFTDTLGLDIGAVEPSLAGPKRPQDRVPLSKAADAFGVVLADMVGIDDDIAANDMTGEGGGSIEAPFVSRMRRKVPVAGAGYELGHGDVVIAAITSCTNTSNPSVMIGAGLVARNALRRGLKVKPWVKTSLAPGSRVVTDYLAKAGLQDELDALGFNLVGYGCTTCIGNSGPLAPAIATAVEEGDLVVAAVLSGNRNFEGRISPQIRANYLASPPLVVAYALAGSLRVDITTDALGEDARGDPVYLRDIWPANQEIQDTLRRVVTPEMFANRYADVFTGDEAWQAMGGGGGLTYGWAEESTYVKRPPYFDGMGAEPPALADIRGARVLAMLGDSITTDHISPAGAIMPDSPAGRYLIENGIEPRDFNSYGSRRGNHEVMMRGTFANVRLRNELAPGTEGGWTRHMPSGEQMTIFDAAMRYQAEGTPLVVVGGRQYGGGSSRDWAAKGPLLLGVKAVIVESFERIHRSNLIGMGVMPLTFKDGETRKTLALDGSETFDLTGIAGGVTPRMEVACTITRADGSTADITLLCRIDTEDEADYYRHGGILHYVLRTIAAAA
ncbi:MAG: aconitate hydratase AcnA [Proteobacteria bacterium]|nr:aconitate hydratase AcnA [Pseudomonadota bacterium]